MTTTPARAGVDVGGTFTDFVFWTGSQLRLWKQPSTPAAPEEAIFQALSQQIDIQRFELLHGTTTATNALLERKGARTAFLTTEGFRDLLFLARQTRRELYSLNPEPAPTVADRALCAEVRERLSAEGQILKPLDLSALPALIQKWKRQKVQSVAVCLLFSYLYPDHERILGEWLSPHFDVSLSSQVAPEFREYERASTTFLNAYVAPRMKQYLSALEQGAHSRGASQLLIAHSNGGLMSAQRAREHPVSTLLSGPAAGVIGAWAVGRQARENQLLTFDMGGTSTDAALIYREPSRAGFGEIDEMPLRLPRIDIQTVGAGGGSLARLDSAGSLRVGPESAGADPGPAVYGKGDLPTVTDAHFVLGTLLPETFGYGQFHLNPARAWQAIEKLAKPLNRSVQETAEAILDQADAQMARALRKVSVARGFDPADFTLIPFGGAGALHVCRLARWMGMTRWLIPEIPGALSAYGLLWMDLMHEAVRSLLIDFSSYDRLRVQRILTDLEEECENALRSAGAPPDSMTYSTLIDLRYHGQSYELTVPFNSRDPKRAEEAFHQAHRQQFGFDLPDRPLEFVNLRMRGASLNPKPIGLRACNTLMPAPRQTKIYWSGETLEVAAFSRSELPLKSPVPVPCLIVQPDTTIWIEPGWQAQVDSLGNIIGTLVSNHE